MRTMAAVIVAMMLAGCGGSETSSEPELQCLTFNASGQFEWGPCPDNTTWTKAP